MKNFWMILALTSFICLPAHAQEQPAAATDTATTSPADTQPADLGADKDELKSQVDSLQEEILANEDLMKEIEELLKDEDIVKLLSNPELVAAITSYDPTKIESNASVQELMKNPKVNELIEKIGKLYENQAAETPEDTGAAEPEAATTAQ